MEIGEIVKVRRVEKLRKGEPEEKRWKKGKIIGIYPNFYLVEVCGKYKGAYKIDEIRRVENE